MDTEQDNWQIQQILKEIEIIQDKIVSLEMEKRGLERILARLRREHISSNEVGRSNSINRILVESTVLERLRVAEKPVLYGELYNAAKNIVSQLKDNTFRSYLSRMKQKGLIKNHATRRGVWMLN